MKRKKHNPEQIIKKLRQADAMPAAGKTIGRVAQGSRGERADLPPLAESVRGVMREAEAKRLKELDEENKRLKKLLAEAELDKAILRGGAQGKLLSPARRR